MITRRQFVRGAAAASALGWVADVIAAEPPPETKSIRIAQTAAGICWAPAYVAGDLLKAEGFSEVTLSKHPDSAQVYTAMAAGTLDVMMAFVAPSIQQIDAGNPLVVLGGVHPGCLELIGSQRVRSVRDLKGKIIAANAPNDPGYLFTSAFVGHVGLDPRRDIQWAFGAPSERARLLAEGKIDAFLASPPFAQEMRAKKVGHVIVNMTTDRPWSQYFCCMLTANREFARKNPVATKRAMRAILKASHLCAAEPQSVARQLVDRGFTKDYEFALQGLRETPYGKWREYDAEDTVRYFALRLKEAGLIRSDPRRIIAEGTDWRFLNELKKELKT